MGLLRDGSSRGSQSICMVELALRGVCRQAIKALRKSRRSASADPSQRLRVPTHRPRAAAAVQHAVARARETRKRGHTAAETPKTRRLRRASAVRPARERPPRPRTVAALDERRESKHTKSREASRRRDE